MSTKKDRRRIIAAKAKIANLRHLSEVVDEELTDLLRSMNEVEGVTKTWFSIDGHGTIIGVIPDSDFHGIAVGEGLVAFRGSTMATFLDSLSEKLAKAD